MLRENASLARQRLFRNNNLEVAPEKRRGEACTLYTPLRCRRQKNVCTDAPKKEATTTGTGLAAFS